MKIENVVVISLLDYEEYQNLKKESEKPKIDFDRLKTGSVVKLKHTSQHCTGSNECNMDGYFDVVFFKTKHLISPTKREFKKESAYDSYCTFHQNGKYILFGSDENTDYITEVISY